MPIFIFAKGKSNLYGLSGICLMLRIPFLLVYQNLRFYKWRKNTNFKFLLLKTSDTPLIQCFLGVYIVLNFIWIFRVQGLFIFAVQYISISLHIFTRYIYISVASRPELRILNLRVNILCSLRILLNTVILILHSACMPIYFLLHTFAGVERFARSQILYYLLYFMYAFLWVQ